MSMTSDTSGDGTETPSNVLLLAPSFESGADAVCHEMLQGPGSNRDHVLLVTCLQSSAERLSGWTDHFGDRSADVTVIDADMSARSCATTVADADHPINATVEHVPDAADLIELGGTVDGHLTSLAAEGETALCVHSVTDLLQRVESDRVFKFLGVLTTAVETAGAVAHYHMNPDVHDPETVRTFEALFDSVVDLRSDD